MLSHRTCDGITRRDFLHAGSLALGSLTLADWFRLQAQGATQASPADAAIFISLGGGPSHLDTFDLKPDAPSEIRGEFNAIQTSVAGLTICEHLPRLAQQMHHVALLRGVSHSLAAHELGTQYVNTGNRPLPSLEFPGYGSVVSKERPSSSDLPSFVAIPETSQRPGYLGVRYAPFKTGTAPTPGKAYRVRGISLSGGTKVAQIERRQRLFQSLDRRFDAIEQDSALLAGLDQFSQQAHDVITSSRAREAFDISQESPEFAAPFGNSPFGQSCLLATRLVSSGVRFVTISYNGWDTHADNFVRLKEKQLPAFDEGLSALLAGLAAKGLLEKTAVYVTGEFGRTPKINERAGRDHFARAMFMLLAGGGVRGGQVIGASDERGQGPASEGISPDDVAASFYKLLGIDPAKEYHTSTGRPVMIVRNGTPIPALIA